MARNVDHIIDAAEYAVIVVGGKNRAVGRVVRPILPFPALRFLVVFSVVTAGEALRIAPDRLHDAWPRIANADVAGIARTRSDFLAVFVPDYRINSQRGGAGAARLHGIERGFRAA